MNNTPFCEILTLRRIDSVPEMRLTELLAFDARERVKSFLSEKRRADFLWARLLLLMMAKERSLTELTFKENPPYSPEVSSLRPLYCSISHTKTFVGAALSTSPVAIDLEVIREDRPMDAISERCFGIDFLGNFRDCDRTLAFYKAWGIHECAVKLKGKMLRTGKILSIRMPEENEAVRITHCPVGEKTLCTLASAGGFTARPRTTTLAQIKETLLA